MKKVKKILEALAITIVFILVVALLSWLWSVAPLLGLMLLGALIFTQVYGSLD